MFDTSANIPLWQLGRWYHDNIHAINTLLSAIQPSACRTHRVARIIQCKQNGNKCWNKILLISPGAANRAAAMEGAKSPFLFYCMNANPAGKRRGRPRGAAGEGSAVTRSELAPPPPAASLARRTWPARGVTEHVTYPQKIGGEPPPRFDALAAHHSTTGSTDFVFNLLRLFR